MTTNQTELDAVKAMLLDALNVIVSPNDPELFEQYTNPHDGKLHHVYGGYELDVADDQIDKLAETVLAFFAAREAENRIIEAAKRPGIRIDDLDQYLDDLSAPGGLHKAAEEADRGDVVTLTGMTSDEKSEALFGTAARDGQDGEKREVWFGEPLPHKIGVLGAALEALGPAGSKASDDLAKHGLTMVGTDGPEAITLPRDTTDTIRDDLDDVLIRAERAGHQVIVIPAGWTLDPSGKLARKDRDPS